MNEMINQPKLEIEFTTPHLQGATLLLIFKQRQCYLKQSWLCYEYRISLNNHMYCIFIGVIIQYIHTVDVMVGYVMHIFAFFLY